MMKRKRRNCRVMHMQNVVPLLREYCADLSFFLFLILIEGEHSMCRGARSQLRMRSSTKQARVGKTAYPI